MDKWYTRKETAIWSWVTLLGAIVLLTQVVLAGRTSGAEAVEPAFSVERTAPLSAAPTPARRIDHSVAVTELLVDAIIQIESAGNPRCVGSAGERGLMQIKSGTWRQTSASVFGKAVPFDRAFDPAMNRRIGSAYLSDLHRFLVKHREQWKGDERSLLLAAYNAGPNALKRAGFNVTRLSSHTQSYVERASALHDMYLASLDKGDNGLQLTLAIHARQDS